MNNTPIDSLDLDDELKDEDTLVVYEVQIMEAWDSIPKTLYTTSDLDEAVTFAKDYNPAALFTKEMKDEERLTYGEVTNKSYTITVESFIKDLSEDEIIAECGTLFKKVVKI